LYRIIITSIVTITIITILQRFTDLRLRLWLCLSQSKLSGPKLSLTASLTFHVII
jgi:hypothetical protein